MKKSATISAAQDARNCRLIRFAVSYARIWRRKPDALLLLEKGTPEQRAEYVKQLRRRVLVGALALASIPCAIILPNNGLATAPAQTEWVKPIGAIKSVQLHETLFSTSTTLVTTEGTFQVYGDAKAPTGSPVTLKRESTRYGHKTSVCIPSDLKPACFQLL